MPDRFVNEMLALTLNRREILKNGEALLEQKRIDIDVEKYYDIDSLEDPELRDKAVSVLAEYGKQLLVEQEFYSEFHRTFVEEIVKLASDLAPVERERVLARSLIGLEKNNFRRMAISENKILQNQLIASLLELYDANNVEPSKDHVAIHNDEDIAKVEQIFEELDDISVQLAEFSLQQRQHEAEGKHFVQEFLGFLDNTDA